MLCTSEGPIHDKLPATLLLLAACSGGGPAGDRAVCTDTTPLFIDADGDGFGEAQASPCAQGAALVGGDCDDFDAERYPGARETCNGLDDDCDGALDPRELDEDGDQSRACRDCDDQDASRRPGAAEICNDIDDNCDGQIDEDNPQATAWYPDQDGDGFGDEAAPLHTCEPPAGYIADGTDCMDGDASVYPGAPERCDDVDHDCDGIAQPRWQVNTVDELQQAVTEADPGQTICLAAGTYPTSTLSIDRPISLEGAGPEATRLQAEPGQTLIRWTMPGGVDAPRGAVRALALQGVKTSGAILDARGSTGVDLQDVHLVADQPEQAIAITMDGVADWSGVQIRGPLEPVSLGIRAPQATLTDLRVDGLNTWWSARPAVEVGAVERASLHALTVTGTASPARISAAFLQARRLHGVVVTDLRLDVPPPGPVQYLILQRGLVLAADEATDIRFDGVSGRVGEVRGPLLRAWTVDALSVHDLDLQGVRLEGLLSTPVSDGSASEVQVTGLHLRDVEVSARSVQGGLLHAGEAERVLVDPIDARDVHLQGAEGLAGGLVYADSAEITIRGSILAGVSFEGPGADLVSTTGAARVSFATWRGVSLSGAGANLADAGICGADHLDLSACTLPATDDACTVTWSNLHSVDGLVVEGAGANAPLHVDTSGDDPTAWDLHLSSGSPLRDAGDPNLRDADGTRADISGYGGP